MSRLRGDEFHIPRLAVRGPRASWEASGSRDTYALAKEAARELSSHTDGAIDEARRAALDEIVCRFA